MALDQGKIMTVDAHETAGCGTLPTFHHPVLGEVVPHLSPVSVERMLRHGHTAMLAQILNVAEVIQHHDGCFQGLRDNELCLVGRPRQKWTDIDPNTAEAPNRCEAFLVMVNADLRVTEWRWIILASEFKHLALGRI